MEDFEENNYSISYSSIDNNEIDDLSVNSSCINNDTMEVNKTGEPLQPCTRSTLSLRKHFTKHIEKVPELDKEKKKPNVSVIDMLQNQQTVNNRPSEPFDLNIFKDLIKCWIVKRNRLFSIVEDNKLKEIFAYLEPQANAPSADSIKRYVMNDFEEKCHKLMSMGIIPKLMAITHNNAASNIKFIQDLSNFLEQLGLYFDYRQQSIRCFTHILNLAVHSLLSVAGNELNKL
ncbi:5119_t:CDS:2 [Cetraspora pellucida]|uniref:5119_t:CDS:1 n=1 Tax=Cetraspora pellucida TaxID=1433469 RepID=A0A9N9K262_9GLOM|nr:5119_t:CDS:2 [Cetraspora pellucida]